MNEENYINYINNNKIDINIIHDRMKQFISNEDICKYLGPEANNKIVKYGDLDNYKNIEQLVNNNDYIIILIESELNIGHWTVILRYNNFIEWFNSYGLIPSVDIDYIDDRINKMLDQDIRHLNILLNECKNRYDIIYNKKPLQKLDENVATCGRWVLMRIITFLFYKFDLNNFLIFIEKLKEHFNLENDELISLLII
jgi:hypothetical protein